LGADLVAEVAVSRVSPGVLRICGEAAVATSAALARLTIFSKARLGDAAPRVLDLAARAPAPAFSRTKAANRAAAAAAAATLRLRWRSRLRKQRTARRNA